MRLKSRIAVTLIYLLSPSYSVCYGQESFSVNSLKDSSNVAVFYFRFDKSMPEKAYLLNPNTISEIDRLLTDEEFAGPLGSIMISASCSFDGDYRYNSNLAGKRKIAVRTYIYWKYPNIDRSIVRISPEEQDISYVRCLVESDPNITNQSEVLDILSRDLPLEEIIELLQQLDNGSSWKYMTQHLFPYMRAGIASFIMKEKVNKLAENPHEVVSTRIGQSNLLDEQNVQLPDFSLYQTSEKEDVRSVEPEYKYMRPLSLKTNLLFDLMTVVNVEAEVPLSKRLSIAGELIFPWWLSESKQRSLQIFSGNVELRYWITPRYNKQDVSLGRHNPLTGWFVGAYVGGGLYDLEWDKKGYRGDNFTTAGITGGYVKALSRNLNLEFSLGVGFLQTDYQHYEAKQNVDNEWNLIKKYQGDYVWIGPTKAKVSLIWYPHFKKRVK